MEEGFADVDWGKPLEEPEASRRPPPTEEPELDEALADLVPSVAVSAAPGKMVPEEILEKSSLRLNAAADAAYDAIARFRVGVLQNRIKMCLSWLSFNMKNFHTMAVWACWFRYLPPRVVHQRPRCGCYSGPRPEHQKVAGSAAKTRSS